MDEADRDEQHYTPEETERRAGEAIRRSFDMAYKPHREMVGKTGGSTQRKRAASKTTEKSE